MATSSSKGRRDTSKVPGAVQANLASGEYLVIMLVNIPQVDAVELHETGRRDFETGTRREAQRM